MHDRWPSRSRRAAITSPPKNTMPTNYSSKDTPTNTPDSTIDNTLAALSAAAGAVSSVRSFVSAVMPHSTVQLDGISLPIESQLMYSSSSARQLPQPQSVAIAGQIRFVASSHVSIGPPLLKALRVQSTHAAVPSSVKPASSMHDVNRNCGASQVS